MCEVVFQCQVFVQMIEIIGRGNFFYQLWYYVFVQYQLMSGGFVGGQCQDGGIWEVFVYSVCGFIVLGGDYDQWCFQFFSGFYCVVVYCFGDVQFMVVVVEVQMVGYYVVGMFVNGCYDGDCFQWVFIFCGFVGQYYCIGVVEDGVSYVVGFSVGWMWVFDYGVQYLGGGDNYFMCVDIFFDDYFLGEDNFFNWDFYVYIVMCNYDVVRCFEDFVEVVQVFLVFDFGDDLDVFIVVGFQVFMDFDDVGMFMDEGGCDEVYVLFVIEDQILFVFFSQCWQGDGDVWQVNVFVFVKIVIVQYFIDNFVVFDSCDFYVDQVIVYQDGVVDGEVRGEVFIGYCNDFVVVDDGFIGSEGEGLVCFQGDVVVVFQFDGMNFWFFGVQQNSGFFIGFVYYIVQVLDVLIVFCIVIVGEVQMYYIYVGFQYFGQYFFRFGFWIDGVNNFGFFYDSFSF